MLKTVINIINDPPKNIILTPSFWTVLCIMLQKLFISDKYWSLDPSIHQRILKKMYSTVLNIDANNNNNKLEQQISILEWFLKDHMTLKTGVMMLKM